LASPARWVNLSHVFPNSDSPAHINNQKKLNETNSRAVFMSEGSELVAGELILGEARTAARGRDEAVERLVREHARLAYRIAYGVLRSHQDAEDAVQETFVRVLRYSARLASVSNPKTWLARIAWRVAVDKSKRQRKRQEVALEGDDVGLPENPSEAISVEAALQSAGMGAALEKFIAALPAKLREPLILSTIEEMTPREAAAVLGINEAAVRSRAFRARQILREKLMGIAGRK
jgi:RNA polymerase sigma-70 factor (ECF subfamily)